MARKEITLSQYWYLMNKFIKNKRSDNLTIYVNGEDKVTGLEYFVAGVKLTASYDGHNTLVMKIKTLGEIRDETASTVKFPLFSEFSIYKWIWKYTVFITHREWKKQNKNKVNKEIQKLNELIAIGFPEDIEKELLK